jgi:crotonobetainyl-CoA:carnitine CoA-transferase CaiB-like acyl-CoA transferase
VAAIRGLCDAGVPTALSAAASDLVNDGHLRDRGFFTHAEHPRFGELVFVSSPVRFHSDPVPAPAVRPPLLGEHTSEILGIYLGMTEDQIAELDVAASLA